MPDETNGGGIIDPNQAPEFPMLAGSERLSDTDKSNIAEAAWKLSGGSPRAFEQLCAEHTRGEINLFSDNPATIGGDATAADADAETAGEAGPVAARGRRRERGGGSTSDARGDPEAGGGDAGGGGETV